MKNIPIFLDSQILQKIKIYIQLMRADKPIGTLLLLWPTLWALWIASEGKPQEYIVLLFIIGTFLMRSAGCVINDFADRDFDGLVERTKNRPFAKGVVSKREALLLCGFLCFFAMLCLIPMNRLTWLMSVPALFLALTYPFFKRFFAVPQFYLGLAFSFGIPMAFAAISNDIPFLGWVIFWANVFWTLAYDTIYAIADKPDDLKIGIKSSAITFGNYDVLWAMFFHFLFTLSMCYLGYLIGARWIYWLAALCVLILQFYQYWIIKDKNRARCFQAFLGNNKIGFIWFVAIFIQYYYHN